MPKTVNQACPFCGTEYDLDEALFGGRAQCSVCNKKFNIDENGQIIPTEANVSPEPAVVGSTSSGSSPLPSFPSRPTFSAEQIVDLKKKLSPVPGIVKDLLHADPTPYELLGVSKGADRGTVVKAWVDAVRKGVQKAQAQVAHNVLVGGSAGRALVDVWLYNEEALEQLEPNPIQNPSVLHASNRLQTASAWESRLKANFPDVQTTHSLAVLWYWWATHEEDRQHDMLKLLPPSATDGKRSKMDLLRAVRKAEGSKCCPGEKNCTEIKCPWRDDCTFTAPSTDELWRKTIAYWSMLAATREMWEDQMGLSEAEANEVRGKLIEFLRNRLADHSQRYHQMLGANHEIALRYRSLEVAFTSELKSAKALSESGYKTTRGRVCSGVLMLQYLGLLDKIREDIYNLLLKSPGNRQLRQVQDMLSPYFPIAVLLDANKPQEALGRIKALSEKERRRKDVSQLHGQALLMLGKQAMELGHFDEALGYWKQALREDLTDESKKEMHDSVVSKCREKAVALHEREPDRAIDILEKGLELAKDQKLELTLGEFLATRAIAKFRQAQKELDAPGQKPNAKKLRNMEALLRAPLADLERATELGCTRAGDNLAAANGFLQQLQHLLEDPRLNMPDKAVTLLEEANEAAEAKNWETAIRKLSEVVQLMGVQTPDFVKNNLGELLATRAIAKFRQVQTELDAPEKKPNAKELRNMVDSLQTPLADLERAAELGCKRAVDNLAAANGFLQQLQHLLEDPRLNMPDKAVTLLEEANEAAEAQDVNTAIKKLFEVVKLLGDAPPDFVKKNLSVLLANRAVANANSAVSELNQYDSGASRAVIDQTITTLQSAETDLTLAEAFDPGSEHVKNNLTSVRGLIDKLGGEHKFTMASSTSPSTFATEKPQSWIMTILTSSVVVQGLFVMWLTSFSWAWAEGAKLWKQGDWHMLFALLVWAIPITGVVLLLCWVGSLIGAWYERTMAPYNRYR